MSPWTHYICDDCWDKQNPERQSHRMNSGSSATCCFCGGPTASGIYVRRDPQDPALACKGAGPEHEK